MSETLERILEAEQRYDLVKNERLLVESYYRFFLYDDTPRPPIADLIRFAAGARNIASMWADLGEEILAGVPADNRSPIARAARVMYFVAELLEEATLKAHWAREASVANLQGGNLAASRIALGLSHRNSNLEVPGNIFLDAVLGTRQLSGIEDRALPEAVKRPWSCADHEILEQGQRRLYELSSSAPDGIKVDKSLAYRICQAMPLFGALSLPGVLGRAGASLPGWYRKSLESAQRMVLMPSQEPAVRCWLGTPKGNGLLFTPTSSGKTFVAEIISVLTLEARGSGVAILVVPYQAIAYSVEKTFRTRLNGSGITVVGAYGEDPVDSKDLRSEKVLLVATPEKLDALMLADSTLLDRATTVVFDELHLVSQPGRGAFYECLIARVLLQQRKTGFPRRIFGMSAVVSNTSLLAAWLDVPEGNLILGKWRPNPLFPAYWHPEDFLFVITDADEFSNETIRKLDKFCPAMPRWPSTRDPNGIANQLKAPLGQRVAWYADRWSQRSNGPTVVFCSSRKQTRELAVVAAEGRPLAKPPQKVAAVRQLIAGKYKYLSLLNYCLERGVAYHNAALPFDVRRCLEDAFQESAVPIVYATTTLAEGSDFPFRSVVVASPSHYDPANKTQAAMSPLLLKNIAGRGGRTSGHLVGDVVQMYSPFQTIGAGGQGIESHEIFLQHLVDPAESIVRSALSSELAKPDRAVAESRLFPSFDRVLKRWPGADRALDDYRDCLFASELRNGIGVTQQAAYEDLMLAGGAFGEPLATRNSPLTLTRLGEAVAHTGYDVRAAATVWGEMDRRGWFSAARFRADDVVDACGQLNGRIPQIQKLRKSNRRPLKAANFVNVIASLLVGGDLVRAYCVAELSASGSIQAEAQRLIEGEARIDSSAHERIEALVEDLKRKIIHELPQFVRVVRTFLEYKNPAASFDILDKLSADLAEVRRRIE